MSTLGPENSADPDSVLYYAPRSLRGAATPSPKPAVYTSRRAASDSGGYIQSQYENGQSEASHARGASALSAHDQSSNLERPHYPPTYRWIIVGTMGVGIALLAIIFAPLLGPVSGSLLGFGKLTQVAATPKTDGSGTLSRPGSLQSISAKTVRTPVFTITNGVTQADFPQPLGISISNAAPGSLLHLTGITKGTRITAGHGSGADDWEIPIEEVPRSFLRPPTGFTGNMNIGVELRTSDGYVLVRSPLQLTWNKSPDASPTNVLKPMPVPSAILPGGSATNGVNSRDNPSGTPPQPIGPEETALLLETAEQLTSQGDIASARIILQRLAGNGNANAAYKLGITYDPAFASRLNAVDMQPDLERARSWYEKARSWGSKQAASRLDQIRVPTHARSRQD